MATSDTPAGYRTVLQTLGAHVRHPRVLAETLRVGPYVLAATLGRAAGRRDARRQGTDTRRPRRTVAAGLAALAGTAEVKARQVGRHGRRRQANVVSYQRIADAVERGAKAQPGDGDRAVQRDLAAAASVAEVAPAIEFATRGIGVLATFHAARELAATAPPRRRGRRGPR